MDDPWQDFLGKLSTTSIFCSGLAGFGGSVPHLIQILDDLLQQHHNTASLFTRLCDEVHVSVKIILEIFTQWNVIRKGIEGEEECDEVKALEASLKLQSVKLCYLSLGLQKCMFGGQWINLLKMKDAIYDISSLPSDYIDHFTVRNVCGCIMSSRNMKFTLNISFFLENIQVVDLLDDKDIDVLKFLKVIKNDEDFSLYNLIGYLQNHLHEINSAAIIDSSEEDLNQSKVNFTIMHNLLSKFV